ncbi:hypothetical protein J0L31_15585 [Terrisporobacter glycolicus]|nr:hypothetical protein [Terrisporobacter glycolicus]
MLNLTEKSFKTVIFKSLKKSVMVFLCAVMIIVTIPNIDVFADELNTNNKTDLYAEKFVENISIEGDSYTYKYYYNENGDKSISILNNTNSTVETITYDDESSNIYLDGKRVAEAVTTDGTMHGASQNLQLRAATKWKSLGSRSKYITWAKAASANVIAGILAITITGGVSAGVIIASCGKAVLKTIGKGAGVRVYWTTWSSKAGRFTRLKYDWALKNLEGKRYGTYHFYDTI